MDYEVSGASVDSWFRACSELLQIRLETMKPADRARFLLEFNVRILEYSAFEIAPVRDPGSVAHLIRMATEVDRMIDGNNVVPLAKFGNP